MPLLSEQQHGNMTTAEHLSSRAANNQMPNPAVSISTHQQQADVFFFGIVSNNLLRLKAHPESTDELD